VGLQWQMPVRRMKGRRRGRGRRGRERRAPDERLGAGREMGSENPGAWELKATTQAHAKNVGATADDFKARQRGTLRGVQGGRFPLPFSRRLSKLGLGLSQAPTRNRTVELAVGHRAEGSGRGKVSMTFGWLAWSRSRAGRWTELIFSRQTSSRVRLLRHASLVLAAHGGGSTVAWRAGRSSCRLSSTSLSPGYVTRGSRGRCRGCFTPPRLVFSGLIHDQR